MFEHFPYSNFHDLNTDWLINRVKNIETSEANAAASEQAAAESATAAAQSATASQQSAQASAQSAQASAQSAAAADQSAEDAAETVSNTAEQVALLQSRVDNIIPTQTQTEGNTELLDIRVGYNGRIFSAAGDAVRNQVENLANSINAMITPLGASDFTWTIGKTISNSGSVQDNVSTSISARQSVTGGTSIVNKSNYLGMNAKQTLLFICEYIGETFQQRTRVYPGDLFVLSSDTTGVRYVFGYEGSAGNTSTLEDINTNFKVEYINEVASKEELDYLSDNLAKAITTDYRNCVNIADNTDYNTLTSPGNYYVSSSAHAQTMTNCPVNVAHKLIVFNINTTANVKQIIIAHATNTPIYVREINGSWNKLVIDSETLTTISNLLTSSNIPVNDFNNLQTNTIYTMATSATKAMINHPKGNNNVAGASDDYGAPQGSVITLKGATYSNDTSEVQLMFGQSGAPYNQPILNFRTKYYSQEQWNWTPWAQLAGLFGVLRATNTFIQESRIQAGTADFTDMNDAPMNTIYQIDLDAVSMLNNPISGRSCVLITFSPSFISNHGSLQVCAGLSTNDAYTPQLYFRYGYRQSVSEFRWTNWLKVATETA